MNKQLSFGYISFGGHKIFGMPENYRTMGIGNKSKPIARAGGSIMDVGYGYHGFSLSGTVFNAQDAAAINDYAISRLSSGNPISVTDTLYPGGKFWSGFFEVPIEVSGQVGTNGALGLPTKILLSEIQLTFYSITEEVM